MPNQRLLWTSGANPHVADSTMVTNHVARPSQFINQELQDVWRSED